jgi:hypothetical protein
MTMKKLFAVCALAALLALSVWRLVESSSQLAYRGPSDPICVDHCRCVTVRETIRYSGPAENLCSACECVGVELVSRDGR